MVGTSLLGSILSNLLLVLGCCFLFGGWRFRVQEFNAMSARACNSLLFLSSAAILLPSAANAVSAARFPASDMLAISRVASLLLLVL